VTTIGIQQLQGRPTTSSSFYHQAPLRSTVLPSSQTMVINNCNNRIKRDAHSCDDIIDHCNNNGDNDNSSSSRSSLTVHQQPAVVTSLGLPVNMSRSYHPHSIFYGQQYAPSTFYCSSNHRSERVKLPDNCYMQNRLSGSSFRSSPHSSVVLMDDNCNNSSMTLQENAYECIPAHYIAVQQEAVTRFDHDEG